jgi:hypothetical protein
LLIGVPAAVEAANTNCSDIPIVQQSTGVQSCAIKGDLEGLGIALSIIGFLLLGVGLLLTAGFAGTDTRQIANSPSATSLTQIWIKCKGCDRTYQAGQFTYCPNCSQKL